MKLSKMAKSVAELIDEGENIVRSGGEIIYDGVEVDDRRVIIKPGRVLFVPEEVHFISKDISLKIADTADQSYCWSGSSERCICPYGRRCRNSMRITISFTK